MASALASSLGLHVIAALYSVHGGGHCNGVEVSWLKCLFIIPIQYIYQNVWSILGVKIKGDDFEPLLFESFRS
jgi:hypothetical protein